MAQPVVTLSADRRSLVTLGVAVVVGADGKLPTEVRLFTAGSNVTEKGCYLFDDEAARLVMAHQASMGAVDRMIDLEHLSLDELAPNYDPDARGWCRLEVRNGELWAVGLTWCPDGVERLTSRKQRYLSPAFPVDEDRRIIKIVNIALTAIPATHDAPALIAASLKGRTMDPILVLLSQLCPSHGLSSRALALLAAVAEGETPAEDGGTAPAGKWATVVKTAAEAADALKGVQKVKDPDEAMSLAQAAQKAVEAFEAAFNALTGGAAPEPVEAAAPAPKEGAPAAEETMHAQERELVSLRAVAAEHSAMVAKLAAERVAAEMTERRSIVGELVRLGHETPATAWSDNEGKVPAEPWASMPIVALRARAEKLGRLPHVALHVAPRPPVEGTGAVTMNARANLSEHEINRLRAVHDRENKGVDPSRRRSFDDAVVMLAKTKERQVAGAAEKGSRQDADRMGRPVHEYECLTNAGGRELVTLASVAQAPIQAFTSSSQRSLEEFRLEFNATLVSQPIPWAEDLGVLLPGGGLKDTYPLAFYAIKYEKLLAENPTAKTPNAVEVSVQKEPYAASAMANLRRLTQQGPDGRGDFAYIQTWQQNAAQMARARINLRNHMIANLLESSAKGGGLATWGVSDAFPSGIDGANFFSASHKVNPFDRTMKFHGATTWGNLTSALPLNATNLTAAKALGLLVAGPDGEEMGTSMTGMLNPTVLKETGRLLLTVQDIITRAGTVDGVANTFAAVTNEHKGSGFEQTWAPQLAGSGATADYYLYSRETIARGLPPWVLAEDAVEEIRTWDENSEFYKSNGFIKIGSYLFCNAALLYPHGISKIPGA